MATTEPAPRHQFFRANVGAVIVNDSGEALALERCDVAGAWQLPQGGLDADEEPLDGVLREIHEETGIVGDDLVLLAEYPEWLSYELPPEMRSSRTGRGQTQRWFLFRYIGDEATIDPSAGGEFSAWRWMPLTRLAQLTVSFRQPVYRRLAAEFERRG